MKCAGCETELQRREHAQPMTVFGVRCWPKSFCDACCRAGLTKPGNAAALERLVRGKVDPDELARVVARSPVTLTEGRVPNLENGQPNADAPLTDGQAGLASPGHHPTAVTA